MNALVAQGLSSFHRVTQNETASEAAYPQVLPRQALATKPYGRNSGLFCNGYHAGIELDRHYVFKYCAPTRSAIQSGRSPFHVNPLNSADVYNDEDPVSGADTCSARFVGLV
jgi:hypothetical protein